MPGNNYPKLHNAMWPGLVGKGPGSEPPIDLDTMLKLTAAARFDGGKFEGVDLFLADPHTSINSLAICFWFSAGLDAQSCTPANHLIDEGRLGKIYHYRAKFLQDWTISKDLPQGGAALWRLDASVAGSGVTGDLLAHCIDTAMWLNGSIDKVTAVTRNLRQGKKVTDLTGKVEPVRIDDACLFLARFANGSLASFEATRYARGHKALYTFEINGEHASIFWDLHDLHRLQYFDHRDGGIVRGWRSLHITDSDHPYMKHWWVPGLQIGYEHSFIHQAADFIDSLESGQPAAPTFRDGFATDQVTGAVLRSAMTG